MITVITLLLASNHYFRNAYYTEGSFVLSLDFPWACFSQSSLSLFAVIRVGTARD